MKNLNYKGKGEHSVNELELIIRQQAEELHLFNSGQKQLNLSSVSQQRELLIAELNKTDLEYIQQQGCTDVLAEDLLKAINNTPCCKELKNREVISFQEWLFVNNYKKLFDYFVKDAISFTERELMQIYNDKVMSL